MRVLLNERVEYAGLGFDLKFTIPSGDKYVTDKFEKYGIEGLAINEEKPNARELIAKAIVNAFLETYNFQNNAHVSLETFVANPGNYPAVIVMRDADKQLIGRTLTIDQVKEVEVRIVSGMNGELYMYMARYSSVGSGYGFEDGKLILYGSISYAFESVDDFYSGEGDDQLMGLFPLLVGYHSANRLLKIGLGLMPYTSYIILEHGNQQKLNNDNIFSWYDKTIDLDRTNYPKSIADTDGYFKWWKHNDPFIAVEK